MDRREESAVVDLVAVVASGFVTMMAVGDEHRLRTHHGRQLGMDLDVGDRPESMDYAQVIGRHQRSLAGNDLVQQILGLAIRVGIKSENRAELRLRHHGEHQPIGLGGRQGFLVRKDLSLAEAAKPLPAEESAADVSLAGGGELLVVDVDGRIGLGRQHALLAPILVELRRAGIAVVLLVVVARLDAVQVDADEVVRMEPVEMVLQFGADHIVRGRDHVAQRADPAEVVTHSTEGLNIGHGWKDRGSGIRGFGDSGFGDSGFGMFIFPESPAPIPEPRVSQYR